MFRRIALAGVIALALLLGGSLTSHIPAVRAAAASPVSAPVAEPLLDASTQRLHLEVGRLRPAEMAQIAGEGWVTKVKKIWKEIKKFVKEYWDVILAVIEIIIETLWQEQEWDPNVSGDVTYYYESTHTVEEYYHSQNDLSSGAYYSSVDGGYSAWVLTGTSGGGGQPCENDNAPAEGGGCY